MKQDQESNIKGQYSTGATAFLYNISNSPFRFMHNCERLICHLETIFAKFLRKSRVICVSSILHFLVQAQNWGYDFFVELRKTPFAYLLHHLLRKNRTKYDIRIVVVKVISCSTKFTIPQLILIKVI